MSETVDPDGAMYRWLSPTLEALGWSVWRLPTQELTPHLGVAAYRALVREAARCLRPQLVFVHPPYDHLDVATATALRRGGAQIVGFAFDEGLFWPARDRSGRLGGWLDGLPARYDLYAVTDAELAARVAARHPGLGHATRFATSLEPFAERATLSAELADEVGRACVFVGRAYPKRARLAGALAEAGLPVRVYGAGWDDPATRALLPDTIPRHGLVPREVMNAIYEAAGVVVTTGDWEDVAVPMVKYRLLEVAMARGFQIAQAAPDLRAYFPADEVPSFGGPDDLVAEARAALADPAGRARRAAAANARAREEHAWTRRLDELVAALPRPLRPDAHAPEPCPALVQGWAQLAHDAEWRGRPRAARELFRGALALTTATDQAVDALAGLARAHYQLGDPTSAADAAFEALACHDGPDDDALFAQLGVAGLPSGLGPGAFLDPRPALWAIGLIARLDGAGPDAALAALDELDDDDVLVSAASLLAADDEAGHRAFWRALFGRALQANPGQRRDLLERHRSRWARAALSAVAD